MTTSNIDIREFLHTVEQQIPLWDDFQDVRDPQKLVMEKFRQAGMDGVTLEEDGVVVDIPQTNESPPAVVLVVSMKQTAEIAIGLSAAAVVNQLQLTMHEKVRIAFVPESYTTHEIARMVQWRGETIPVFLGFSIGTAYPAGYVAIPMAQVTLANHDFCLRLDFPDSEEQQSISVAARVVTNLDQILARKTDPLTSARIAFSSIRSLPENTQPDRVEITGKVYLREDGSSSEIMPTLEQSIATICETYGTGYQFDFESAERAVNVDGMMSNRLRRTAEEILGKDNVLILEYPSHEFDPLLGYFKQAPGSVVYIGAADKRKSESNFAVAIQTGVKTLGWTLLNNPAEKPRL